MRLYVAHELSAIADVNLVGALDATLQRAKYVDLPGLDACAHVSVGRDREKLTGHVDSALYLTLNGERLAAVNFSQDRDVLGGLLRFGKVKGVAGHIKAEIYVQHLFALPVWQRSDLAVEEGNDIFEGLH